MHSLLNTHINVEIAAQRREVLTAAALHGRISRRARRSAILNAAFDSADRGSVVPLKAQTAPSSLFEHASACVA